MRYSTTINNIKSKEWDLTIQQAYLFSWFYELPSWANKVMIENEIFYFASKTKAVEELPILTDKTDTMYRYYKQLEELDLIIIKKIDNKDYIALTNKGKEWNFCKSDNSENNPNILGNLSENNSENNPNILGNLSENNSENNPTYNNIIYNNNINNNKEEKFSFLNSLIELGVEKQLANDWILVRKNKRLTNTKTAFDCLKIEFEKCGKPINEIISKCCKESWGGFKASWDWKESNQSNQPQKQENNETDNYFAKRRRFN